MSRVLAVWVAVALIIPVAGLYPDTALACSCAISTPQERYERSKAVFIGRVVDIDDSREFVSAWGDQHHRRVDLEVTERWKGIESNFVTVATAHDEAACGYDFQPDTKYLIYAYDGEYLGAELSTGICGGVTPLTEAREQLEVLGPGNTQFSDDEIVYAHGSFPVNEGLLWWLESVDGTELAWWVFFKAPMDIIHGANHEILTGPWYSALRVIALYLVVPVVLLYWLWGQWSKRS